jgi:phosphomevalonate kinase
VGRISSPRSFCRGEIEEFLIGKRKLDEYCRRLGHDNAEIIRISEPIKSTWAKEKNLDLAELLSDGPYKEKYRKQMIVWSDERRAENPGIFCSEASKNISKSTVIVSDIRRKTDIKWFRETFGDKIKLIRIRCDDSVRIARGWKFQEGVDDIQSECDLDDWSEWDLLVENDGNKLPEEILDEISKLLEN